MEVRATTTGFYKGTRRREGTTFDMDDDHIKRDKDGKIVKPKWVADADAPIKKSNKNARGDTKPAAAQVAAKAKATGEGGNDAEGLA